MSKGPCPGCNGRFPDLDGPTHAYLTVSPGCWARFGQALALHYSDYRYWPAHQLLTDAYSLQHSRGEDPRAARSAMVHLGALFAQIELGQAEARIIALRRTLTELPFAELPEPWPMATISIADVDLSDPEAHRLSVDALARTVLTDWSDFHSFAAWLCAA